MNGTRMARAAVLVLMCASVGCRSLYYGMWEKMGREKRHLLRANVEKAQKEQGVAAEQFKDVLTRIQEMTGFQGGDLEAQYRKLKGDYDDCVDRAAAVRQRLEAVQQVAADMFAEWEDEIGQISKVEFRQSSQAALGRTRERYERLLQVMNQAEGRLDPLLTQLNDYVLFLKHNLNAQAIGALREEVSHIEADVDQLVRDMNASIREADAFLAALK